MSEVEPCSRERTKLEVITPRGESLGTIEVPFSQEEVDLLRSLREIKEPWGKVGVSGSGIERELSTGLVIPFYRTLMDREKALGDMRESLDMVRKTLENKAHPGVIRLTDDLHKIEEGLSSFFPEEQE